MTTKIAADQDDDMPANIDISKGVRGKFYHPNVTLNIPVYLDKDVQAYLAAIAARKGIPISWCQDRGCT
jgi:hypothetical protein